MENEVRRIDMKVTLTMSTPEALIGESAKICYATKTFEDGGKDITHQLVHGHSHLAALRFAYATVLLEDVSVACQNQMVRSSHLDFMVQSKRYVKPSKGGFKFIMPPEMGIIQEKAMTAHWESSMELYNSLIDQGVKKEDARAILPANTSTKMYVTGNLQGFWSMFALRLNGHAQAEIREVAEAIYDVLAKEFPQVFTPEQKAIFQEGK